MKRISINRAWRRFSINEGHKWFSLTGSYWKPIQVLFKLRIPFPTPQRCLTFWVGHAGDRFVHDVYVQTFPMILGEK